MVTHVAAILTRFGMREKKREEKTHFHDAIKEMSVDLGAV